MPHRQTLPTRTPCLRRKRRNHRRLNRLPQMPTMVPHPRRNTRNAAGRTQKRSRRLAVPQKMENKNSRKHHKRRQTLQPKSLNTYSNFATAFRAEDRNAASATCNAFNPSTPETNGSFFSTTQSTKCCNSNFNGS